MAQKPRRDRRRTSQVAASDGDVDRGLERFASDLPIGSGMETATIGEVTPAMMDDVAHRVAEAVDAAAHHVVVQTGNDEAEHQVDPLPYPSLEAANVLASESEFRVSPELDPDTSLAAESPTIGIESPAGSSHSDAVEATPAPIPRLEPIEPSAAVEGAAVQIAAEATSAGATLATPTNMTPLARVPTSSNGALEGSGETLRRSLPSSGETIGVFGAQVVEMLAANMAATGQFLTALMEVTSVTELVAVNTHHLRRQMEMLTTQGRQWTTLSRTMALDVLKLFGTSSSDHPRDR